MKRLVIGKPSKRSSVKTGLGQGLLKAMHEAVDAEKVKPCVPQIYQAVVEKHTHTTVLTPGKDKRARKHSVMAAKRNAMQLDEMCDTLNEQNEQMRASRRGIHSIVEQMDALKAELNILKAQKPVEIHTVTKEIVLTPQPQNKLVIAGVILSIVLSILSLVK